MRGYSKKRKKSKKILSIIVVVCVLLCASALFFTQRNRTAIIPHEDVAELSAQNTPDTPDSPGNTDSTAAAGQTGPGLSLDGTLVECEPTPEPICGVICSGDTAGLLLKEYLSSAEIHAMAAICKPVHPLERLRIGQPYIIEPTLDGKLARFEYEIDRTHKLVVTPDNEDFVAELQTIVYDIEYARISGEIRSNLFLTVSELGEQAGLAVALADIFAWEIDFIRDIRVGDSFTVLVEKRFRDGEFKGYGNILAANFINQEKEYSGFLFVDAIGNPHYFAEDGGSMRRAFLKAPLSFTRISSNFTYNRRHPIFNDVRAHEGIDYAAPMGTPVMSVGSGVVTHAGVQGGYGNLIIVRHSNGYETYYAHLSKYARGLAKGVKVQQGEVIGYVGMTGWATGPHLDFRIKREGRFVNPANMLNPRTDPVSDDLKPVFQRRVATLKGLLHDSGADLLLLAEMEPLPAL